MEDIKTADSPGVNETQFTLKLNHFSICQWKVINYSVLHKEPVDTLTKFQRLLCKWFKITPKPIFRYLLVVDVDNTECSTEGDLLMDPKGLTWVVTDMSSDRLFIESVPLLFIEDISAIFKKGDVLKLLGISCKNH